MSGPDENLSKSPKTNEQKTEAIEPLFETADFSVSTDGKLSGSFKAEGDNDNDNAAIDAYATQVTQQPASTRGTARPGDAKSKSNEAPIPFPTDIPGFKVEGELGRGAFGVVYNARDEMLDRKVAIKRPLISNPAHRKQYIDEARKAVKLDHPGIVPIYQVGMTVSGEPFVVQKLIEGSTLRVMLQNGAGRLTTSQSIAIMRQVCLAVDAAHAAGIVHRDLKPENLLVEPDGRVYVADFGLAILEDDEQNKKGREVAGTPLYMSPEQFAGRVEWLDGRSDIWALGVIFYEMLSGKTPFTGKTLNELKDQIKNKDPRPIHQRDPKIPPVFDALFRKCCAKNVADRFASARELTTELDLITAALPHLETVAWDVRSGVSSSVRNSMGSASINASQTWLESLGLATQRKTQSTIRSTMGGATMRRPSAVWSLVGPILTTVATLIAITSLAWYLKLGPFAAIVQTTANIGIQASILPSLNNPNDDSGDPGLNAGLNEDTKTAKKTFPKVAPVKPFRVSIGDGGTHDSIAQAINDSDADDTITILEGTYRESIVIDRSIKLVGEGSVRVISTDGSCVKLQADSQVTIENIDFDCQAKEFNTIDMQGGQLVLRGCKVFASSPESYDCVKARANSVFLADGCEFQSTVHAAVAGEKNSSITIRNSNFSFSGSSDAGSKRIGIQSIGAQGVIQGCTFTGPCNGGIDWLDCPDPEQELKIEGCQFDNCDVGIQVKACHSVLISGTNESPCTIKNAIWGVSIKQSKVNVQSIVVEASNDRNKSAIQVTEGSDVTFTDSDLRGMVCGILVNRSSMHLDNVSTHDISFAGMMVDGGKVDGDDLHLLHNHTYGLVVLSEGASVKVDTLEVQAVPKAGQKVNPAIYAASGSIEFREGTFTNCLSGIFVDPSRIIINATVQPAKRSLIELIGGDPQTIVTTSSPVTVNGERMTIKQCDRAWMFLGPGSSQIEILDGDLDGNQRAPQLTSDLELDLTDVSKITVIRKER